METEMKNNFSVAVVGGVNMDISGQSAARLVPGDSNPGRISVRPGGVGRNIAHDLHLLGQEVSLIAAVGGDLFGAGVADSCWELGIDLSLALVLPEEHSSVYLCVNDANGDMTVAVNDMDITDRINSHYLESCMTALNSFDAVVMDANLTAEAIEYLAENCSVPLYADPVSAIKAPRVKNVLPKLRAFKPNLLEAQTLTGESDPEKAALALLKLGVKRVVVSLGENGLVAAEGDRIIRLTCQQDKVVNTTGAGDAVTAAMVWSDLQGWELERSAAAALHAGELTCQVELPNNDRLWELTRL